jgi:hypothetical protein
MTNSMLFLIFALQLAITAVGYSQTQLSSEVKLGLSYTLKFNGVAKDLELTQEQNERLIGLWVEVETKLGHAFQNYKANYSPRFSEEKQDELKQELAAKIDDVRKTEMERLNEVLVPQQLKRLNQIRFQILKRNSDGLQALVDELRLTQDQVSQIKKVKAKLKATLRELQQYARKEQLSPNELAEEVQALRKQHQEDLLAVLSTTQRSKLKGLEGEPFEVQTGTPKKADD